MIQRLGRAVAGAALAFVLGTVAGSGTASAVTMIAGGQTDVTVTADLGGLGLTPSLFGTAKLVSAAPFLKVGFPVTGGTIADDGNLLIEHDGSGVTLTAGTTSATIGNFLVDTANANVSGDVIGGASGVTFFNFGTGDALPGVELLISPDLAGALTAVFKAPNLSGEPFGYAVPQVSPVPIPAGLGMIIAGLGALGIVGARRKRGRAAA